MLSGKDHEVSSVTRGQPVSVGVTKWVHEGRASDVRLQHYRRNAANACGYSCVDIHSQGMTTVKHHPCEEGRSPIHTTRPLEKRHDKFRSPETKWRCGSTQGCLRFLRANQVFRLELWVFHRHHFHLWCNPRGTRNRLRIPIYHEQRWILA